MNLKVIACKVLFRELSLLAAHSKNFIDITYLRQGFHNEPEVLRKMLQHEIDKLDAHEDCYSYKPNGNKDFDGILIGYGLCSNGIIGLCSQRYRLIIPRAHDCITLFLGSKEKYKDYFDSHKGVYWYTPGWLDNTPMPGQERYEYHRNHYIEKYGEDNADYLMDMEQGWFKEYKWCTYIEWPQLNLPHYKEYTRQCADFLHWNYDEVMGSSVLLDEFLEGIWDESKFQIVPPGKKVAPSFDEKIITIA